MQQDNTTTTSDSSKSRLRSIRLSHEDWAELTYAAELHGCTVNDEVKNRCRNHAVEVRETAEIVDLHSDQDFFNGKGCSVCHHEFETYTNPPAANVAMAEVNFCPHCGRRFV